jgi:hypothetical protein
MLDNCSLLAQSPGPAHQLSVTGQNGGELASAMETPPRRSTVH